MLAICNIGLTTTDMGSSQQVFSIVATSATSTTIYFMTKLKHLITKFVMNEKQTKTTVLDPLHLSKSLLPFLIQGVNITIVILGNQFINTSRNFQTTATEENDDLQSKCNYLNNVSKMYTLKIVWNTFNTFNCL